MKAKRPQDSKEEKHAEYANPSQRSKAGRDRPNSLDARRDPLRAKFIAETYLENPKCFNTVRNMLGYTGIYRGKPVSVMGSGMGMPSIGIYSYELFHFYGVENIIRIGTAGGIADQVQLRDLIAGIGACTDSNYAAQYRLPGAFAPTASFALLEKAVSAAGRKGVS